MQAQLDGLRVYAIGRPGSAYSVARKLLTILGEVAFVTATRRAR